MLIRLLQDSLMPVRCIFCNVRCKPAEIFICEPCMSDLPWQETLETKDPSPLTVVAAALVYDFPVDAALKLLKFHRRIDYIPGLAELLSRTMDNLSADIDALLPMPLHWRRQAMRGFNQAYELTRVLRKKTGLPLVRGVRRIRPTAYQSGLNADARRRNLCDAFVAREPVLAKHVLIIDDVITTGESCRQLAKVVLDAGAEQVSALAVSRT